MKKKRVSSAKQLKPFGTNKNFKFANIRTIYFEAWAPSGKFIQRQGFVPADRFLGKKLGITSKAKVLVFAGYFGDWARALSKTCAVKYTDLGPKMTRLAATKKSNVKSFTTRPAELLVRRPKVYDWSFSFEPYPVGLRGMSLVFIRSLLNKKGCKIAERDKGSSFVRISEHISEIYGANSTVKTASISGTTERSTGQHEITILTLRTNASARKKAMLDLKLLHYLNLAAKNKKQLTFDDLRKKLNVSEKQLEESRKRLKTAFF